MRLIKCQICEVECVAGNWKQKYCKDCCVKMEKIYGIGRDKRRRLRENNIIKLWTGNELKDLYKNSNGVCSICGKYFGKYYLALDHIYPIFKADLDYKRTGIKRGYRIKDLQLICFECNSRKGSK